MLPEEDVANGKLAIHRSNQHLDLVLDQGFGFWQPIRRTPYDFQADDNVQVRIISETAFTVAGEQDRATDIFVDLRQNVGAPPDSLGLAGWKIENR